VATLAAVTLSNRCALIQDFPKFFPITHDFGGVQFMLNLVGVHHASK